MRMSPVSVWRLSVVTVLSLLAGIAAAEIPGSGNLSEHELVSAVIAALVAIVGVFLSIIRFTNNFRQGIVEAVDRNTQTLASRLDEARAERQDLVRLVHQIEISVASLTRAQTDHERTDDLRFMQVERAVTETSRVMALLERSLPVKGSS